jgi:small subunit ribosomal protein S16
LHDAPYGGNGGTGTLVRIRLRRMGAKGQPSYRVVIADSRSPRDGRFIEIIGHYNPRMEPSEIVINKEKALAWIAKGAQPSESVYSLLARAGIIERSAIPVKGNKNSPVASADTTAAAVSAEA